MYNLQNDLQYIHITGVTKVDYRGAAAPNIPMFLGVAVDGDQLVRTGQFFFFSFKDVCNQHHQLTGGCWVRFFIVVQKPFELLTQKFVTFP